jgi:hypothetical protein
MPINKEGKCKIMQDLAQLLVFVIIAAVLLWFGFTLFMGQWAKIHAIQGNRSKNPAKGGGAPGDPQICPICSSKLNRKELVKTLAFPSITGGKDRLMHIRGCKHCIEGKLERHCPICGTALGLSDVLVARIFERANHKPHVHITGCNKCRRTGKL